MSSTQPLDSTRDEHRIHLIIDHLMWYSRRRKNVLTDEVAVRCRAVIEETRRDGEP